MQIYLHVICLKKVCKGTKAAKLLLITIAAWARRLQLDISKYRYHLNHSKDFRTTDNRKSVPRTDLFCKFNGTLPWYTYVSLNECFQIFSNVLNWHDMNVVLATVNKCPSSLRKTHIWMWCSALLCVVKSFIKPSASGNLFINHF